MRPGSNYWNSVAWKLALFRCKSNFSNIWAWPYCVANRTFKILCLALLRCKSTQNRDIFPHGVNFLGKKLTEDFCFRFCIRSIGPIGTHRHHRGNFAHSVISLIFLSPFFPHVEQKLAKIKQNKINRIYKKAPRS